jgi:large subunit GTPase 1
MGFRCVDLENYVGEVGSEDNDGAVPGKGQRKSLLLINKADLLTIEQRYVNRVMEEMRLIRRSMWADYFEKQNITYAFFSAADAAAAQEQAERMWRRENDMESDPEDEEEEVNSEGETKEDEESGEDEEESEEEEKLSKKVQDTTLDSDYEEGWSTEGEDDDQEGGAESAMDKKVANGDKIPMKEVVAEVNERAIKEQEPATEDERTRVLSVTELEDLFVNAAPELHRMSFLHPQGQR